MSAKDREWHQAPESEEREARVRLKRFREMAGKVPEDLEEYTGNSTSNYYDLEGCNGELYRNISLGKLASMCAALGIRPRDLFEEHNDAGESISPEELISKAGDYLSKGDMSIDEFENRIGFEIGPSLRDVSKVMDWNVDFLRWLCRELELNWLSALPVPQGRPPYRKHSRSPPPSFHYTVRSRSLQPVPVGFVPPRSPNLDFGRCVQRAQRRTSRHAPKVEPLSAKQQTHMSYLNEFEQELRDKINYGKDLDVIVRWISEKVLESYRNGIKAGQKGQQVIRDGKSRRKGGFPN